MFKFGRALALGALCVGGTLHAADEIPGLPKFGEPTRMMAGKNYVKVEAPGYASPCWADIDADGKKDLLVGQFADGKIKVWKGLGNGKLAEGQWLQAGGEVAKVPGVW